MTRERSEVRLDTAENDTAENDAGDNTGMHHMDRVA
ncbi:MAG: hypothetical protein ACJA07_004344 [Rhodococcus sp. (in: high G+C Gram-positive bacteria)]|mgnify:FL=1|jgi:hypothetical protein